MNNCDKKIIFKITLLLTLFYLLVQIYLENFSFDWNHQPSIEQKEFYKIERYGSLAPSNVTVISQYFYLEKSKHSYREYKEWLTNFFTSVSSPLVIFTDRNFIIQDLIKIRIGFDYPTTLYITDSIWNLMSENEIKRNRNYKSNYKRRQLKLDREKKIHNPDLYAVWNLKSFIVDKLAQENLYNSTAFVYSDSGAWRQQVLERWPDQSQVLNLIDRLNEKILLGQLCDVKECPDGKKRNFPDFDIIEGTFFMGSKKALNYFKEEFWSIHDEKLDKGEFVGKDQIIMNIFAFHNKTSSNSIKLDIWRRKCNITFDNPWNFYQNYLAWDYPCANNRESLLSINRI